VLAVNKNASVTYDVTSAFDVISKYYSKVEQLMISIVCGGSLAGRTDIKRFMTS